MSDASHLEKLRSGSAADVRNLAAAWLVKRRDHEDWKDDDQAELDGWLAQSPAHKIAYLRVEAAWRRADRLGALRRPASSGNRFAPLLKFVAVGAAVAAICGVYLTNTPIVPPGKLYVTGVGGHETLTLLNGSRIELNTNTSLRLAADGPQQTAYLDKGEAFFDIVHNANRKFVVIAGERRIIDLGTQFLVRRDKGKLRVALYEGKAQFEADDARGEQQTTLNPGDVVVATAQSLSVTRHPVADLSDQLGWRHGLLIFHHATLADAAAEYNRYNLKKIVVADPRIAHLNINGSLPVDDPNALTRSVKRFFDLHVEEHPNEIVITR